MSIKNKKFIVIGIIMLVIIAYFILTSKKPEISTPLIETKFYDENKKQIDTKDMEMSIVNNIPGIAYISFAINVQNTGDTQLALQTTDGLIYDITTNPDPEPSASTAFKDVLNTTVILNIEPNQLASFGESELLDIRQYEGTKKRFKVEITANPGNMKKYDSVELKIDKELTGEYIIVMASSGTAAVGQCAGIDCSCPSTATIMPNGRCCYTTTQYYNGRCDTGTSWCIWDVRENSASCGGPNPCSPQDCTIDVCSTCGWVFSNNGYCNTTTANCIYQKQVDSPNCPGGGSHTIWFRTRDYNAYQNNTNWLAVDTTHNGTITGLGYSRTYNSQTYCIGTVIGNTPEGYTIKSSPITGAQRLHICRTSPSNVWRYISNAGSYANAVKSSQPTSPYAEQCKELYN